MLLDLDLLNDEQLEKDATSASALAIRKAEKQHKFCVGIGTRFEEQILNLLWVRVR